MLRGKGSVVYRASPTQKADLIEFIKKFDKNRTTLAIGDGANDVNMLQAAHIGVGILGREGTYAASQADFSIGKFKHLRRLLFSHGSSYGTSLTDYIVFDISRMTMAAVAVAFFSFWNGFSGT